MALGFRTGLVSFDFGLTTVSSCLRITKSGFCVLIDGDDDGLDVLVAPALQGRVRPGPPPATLSTEGCLPFRRNSSARLPPAALGLWQFRLEAVSLRAKPINLVEHPLKEGFGGGGGYPGPLELEDFLCAGGLPARAHMLDFRAD